MKQEFNKYEVEMLDVKAADAFLIHYIDSMNRSHIIMVDSGNYNDADKILKHIRTHYTPVGKKYIVDYAIVTHPDEDHFGGFVKMLELIQDGDLHNFEFRHFVVNDPSMHDPTPSLISYIYNEKGPSLNNNLKSVYSYQDSPDRNLLQLIDDAGIKRFESFDNRYDVPFITFLGPSKEYYESLIPRFRDGDEHNSNNTSMFSAMDDADDDNSAHNQSSIIFLFEPEVGREYLFTGDAGIEAFNNIPDELQRKMENVYWLKVPHHGSKHNLNSEIIERLNPTVAYISADSIDQCVVDALKTYDAKVYSTCQGYSYICNNPFSYRVGMVPARPM